VTSESFGGLRENFAAQTLYNASRKRIARGNTARRSLAGNYSGAPRGFERSNPGFVGGLN
jgi:hypothetical protein